MDDLTAEGDGGAALHSQWNAIGGVNAVEAESRVESTRVSDVSAVCHGDEYHPYGNYNRGDGEGGLDQT